MGKYTRAININVSSFNEEANTFDVVFATETPATQWSWKHGYFEETLEISKKAIDMTRLDAGAPFLKDHRPVIDNVIGKVEKAWLEPSKDGKQVACATIRLTSVESAAEIREKIKEGILCNVSVGYQVTTYQEEVTKEGERKKFRAIKWQPIEISAVAIPADYKAQMRDNTSEDGPDSTEYIQIEQPNTNTTEQMSKDTQAPETKTNAEDVQAALVRAAAINKLCAEHGYDTNFANTHITRGTTEEALGLIILEDIKARNVTVVAPNADANAHSTVKQNRERTEEAFNTKVNALLLRNGILKDSDLTAEELKEAKQYRELPVIDVVRAELHEAGASVPLSNKDVEKAYYRRITSSMDDFPNLMNAALDRAVIEGYKYQDFTWRQFCKLTTLEDFLPRKRNKGGLLIGNLHRISETEEYKNLKLNDIETLDVELETRGGIINFSRQLILSDRLGYFLEQGQAAGRAAYRTIETTVYNILLNAINDGTIPNDGPAAAITADRLFVAYSAMNEQTINVGDGNVEYLDYSVYMAISNAANKARLNQFNGSVFEPGTSGQWDVPSRITGNLKKLVESPRIGKNILLLSNPSVNAALEIAFLNGIETPYTEIKDAFRQDGYEMKIRHDWTADLMDPKAAKALKTL